MTNRSRLSRRTEQRTKKSLVLTAVGILIVLFLLFKFGIMLITNLGLFISSIKESNEPGQKNNANVYIPIPVLNPTFTATFSAKITISGTVPQKEKIQLYVNNRKVDQTESEKDNTFSFDGVTLSKGENEIKAKTIDDNKKESSYSNTLTILYKTEKPTLSIDSPDDGKTFSKDDNATNVTGKTDPGVKVTVNGFWAIVDSDGKYSYHLSLQSGENKIKVVVTDEADNTAEAERKVTYNQ